MFWKGVGVRHDAVTAGGPYLLIVRDTGFSVSQRIGGRELLASQGSCQIGFGFGFGFGFGVARIAARALGVDVHPTMPKSDFEATARQSN